GRIVPIESTKSRSLAVASAGGRPRAPVERFQGCRRQLALVCAHGWDLSGLNLDKTSICAQLRSQIQPFLAHVRSQFTGPRQLDQAVLFYDFSVERPVPATKCLGRSIALPICQTLETTWRHLQL
ncbi:MAG: hypothetical protein WBE54_23100, partial [Bradyrhizobium sp.]